MRRQRRCSPQTIEVLAALLERPRDWRHGYELSAETGLKSGTLYPILMRLSDRGWLESGWQPSPEPGRPPRHRYRLTASGCGYARDEIAHASTRTLRGSPA